MTKGKGKIILLLLTACIFISSMSSTYYLTDIPSIKEASANRLSNIWSSYNAFLPAASLIKERDYKPRNEDYMNHITTSLGLLFIEERIIHRSYLRGCLYGV